MTEPVVTITAAPPGGGRPLRRQFRLPEDDEEYLDGLGLPWETVEDAALGRWVLLHEHPLPPGYTADRASVGVLVAPGYPVSPLDMAYFAPPPALATGRAIPNTQFSMTLDGLAWQGWSRHRTGTNPWQPGVDSIKTHHALVQAWLAKEVAR